MGNVDIVPGGMVAGQTAAKFVTAEGNCRSEEGTLGEAVGESDGAGESEGDSAVASWVGRTRDEQGS